jgi:thymidylate kinase
VTVLVEGVDLTGKSTLARGLATALGGERHLGAFHQGGLARLALRRYRSGVDPTRASQTWLFSLAECADAFLPATSRAAVRVQEVYVDHTIALAEVLGRHAAAALCRGALPFLPRFDATIYLRADVEVRRRRLAERPQTDRIDRLVVDDPVRAEDLERRLFAYVRRRPRLLVLDSGRLDPEQMIASAISHVLP